MGLLHKILKELREQNQLIRKKESKTISIVLAVFSAILLAVSAWIQWNSVNVQEHTAEIQRQSLILQGYYEEISTRPYLAIDIQEFSTSDANGKIHFRFKVLLSNKGNVPARNVTVQKIGSFRFPSDRSFDIIPGQDIRFFVNGDFVKPIEKNYIMINFIYYGIPLDNKEPRKYQTLFAAQLGRRNGEIVYDPVAIKMDHDAFLYREAFMMLNKDKADTPPIWPKLR